MNELIKKIAQKVAVDYCNLSIVGNLDGVLTQDAVRTFLYQQHGIEVVVGSNLRLRTHYELIYKANRDQRFLYVSSSLNTILADMRGDAFVCEFNIADVFSLFADKSLLRNLPFEVLDELYSQTYNRRVSLAEGKSLVTTILRERELKARQSAEYCLGRLTQIELDWRDSKATMEAVSDVVVNAIRHGVYPQIVPAIDAINQTFQKWVDEEYFATLHSNYLLRPKSVNNILPHLAEKHNQHEKLALLVVDGFAYWQYTILREHLRKFGIDTQDGCTLSWLPSITMLSRQAIFRGGIPQQDYKQSPENERKLWSAFWQQHGFDQYELQYISDKDELTNEACAERQSGLGYAMQGGRRRSQFAINEGVRRLAIMTVEIDEKMHSSTDNKDLLSLTENWCGRISEQFKAILDAGFHLYLTTDHGSTLSYGWRPLLMGNLILVEGTDPDKHYDLSSVNDNVFPYEVKKYKYVHYRTSMDFSGSQAIVKIDENNPYEMSCEPFEQQDVVYSDTNVRSEVSDWSAGDWFIGLHLDEVLEQKLSIEDQEVLNLYQVELANQTDEEQNESNA